MTREIYNKQKKYQLSTAFNYKGICNTHSHFTSKTCLESAHNYIQIFHSLKIITGCQYNVCIVGTS